MRKSLKKNNYLFDYNSVKIMIIGCLAIISALIVMSITIMTIMEDEVVGKLKTNDLKIFAESISVAIEGKIDKAVESSHVMANDPLVKNWVESGESDPLETNQVRLKMMELVENLGYDTAFLVSKKTMHYWSYHGSTFEPLDTVSKFDSYDEWFFTFLNKKTEYEINIDYNKELNDTYVWINTLGGDVDNPQMVTGLGLNLSQVIKYLIENENGIKNDIWLVDENGTICLAKNKSFIEKNIKEYLPASLIDNIYKEKSLEDQFEVGEYKNSNKETYDIAYKKIKNTEWRLMVQIPRSESLIFLKDINPNM